MQVAAVFIIANYFSLNAPSSDTLMFIDTSLTESFFLSKLSLITISYVIEFEILNLRWN